MNHYLAEFVGTAILILLGNGVVANAVLAKSKGNSGGWIVITAGWAFAVGLAVYATGRISGAHLNPAVTLALATTGGFPWAEVPGYIASQLGGAIAGATLVWLTYLSHWGATEDKGAKLACFCTAPAIRSTVPNFITEFIGTAMLVFAVMAIGRVNAGNTMDAGEAADAMAGIAATWWSPLLVALTVFSIGLSLGGPTGYAINPARDLGPRIAHAILPVANKGSSDWSYAWIPVAAPIAGGIAGGLLFKALGFAG
ncbi:aquaporin family protein [Luteolibacter ambystomatis]|uniref:Aquaporin family protein n=1 Tax=Luteolibacter ambystomatis TaxID=2824561 RepID=A0A975J0R8_9BACT|nr:MIP/aquaporin family protein [Luteolibacter ambystomatis]QUE51887.1 aquaporin family protein [Luteolibacter ambystomatis]